ncbi:MAG: O-antigen ligase family protein [Oscillospiraceae bacterium]|nr:O-antigen ligase family protein [Oscillospiraceae bacterium]
MNKLIRQSAVFNIICFLWLKIKAIADRSLSGGILRAIMNFFGRLTDASGIRQLFLSRSATDEKWRESMTYRLIDAVVNFIPWLIGKISDKFEPLLGGSFIFRGLRKLGGFAPYMVCLSLVVMMSVHHKYWNNTYSLVLAVLSIGFLWLSSIRGKGAGRIDIAAIGFWPIVFAVVCVASAMWSRNVNDSFRFLIFFITCMMLAAACVSSVSSEKQLYALLLSCALGLIICSVYGFYQKFVLGIPASSSFTDLSLNATMPGRVYSFFDNPNTFANVLVFFAPLMLTLTIYAPKMWTKVVFALAFIVAAGALLTTFSRGAWLAFAASVAIIVLLLRPRLIPLFVVAVIIMLPFLPASIFNRIITIFVGGDSSINSRAYIYTAMYELIKDYPLTGVGLGAGAVKKIADYGGYYQAHFPFVHAHSIYLEICAESGIMAITSFVFTVFFALKKGVTTVKSKAASPLLKGVGAGCVGGIAGAMVFGITDYGWYYPRVMVFFWILAAIVYTAAKLCKQRANQE